MGKKGRTSKNKKLKAELESALNKLKDPKIQESIILRKLENLLQTKPTSFTPMFSSHATSTPPQDNIDREQETADDGIPMATVTFKDGKPVFTV